MRAEGGHKIIEIHNNVHDGVEKPEECAVAAREEL